MREFVIKALRNYGYRFLENQNGCYTFGKPLGYGILRADVREGENSVSVMLIVKGNKRDGKRPNLIWQQTIQGIRLCEPLPTVRQTSSPKRLWLCCKTET